jgi:microcystin-dependent protein
MQYPNVGTIICVAFKKAITGWATCDGSILPIIGNTLIFSLIGNTYGGDGKTTFALPDLRGRAPRHFSVNNRIGTAAGNELATIDLSQLPAHTHTVQASSAVTNATDPSQNLLAASAPRGVDVYSYIASLTPLDSQVISTSGASPTQPHDNIQPFVAMDYQIALNGVFPSGPMDSGKAFTGEIRIFASHQIPDGWLPCDGQALPSSGNTQLYALIGDTYGSPSPNTFKLPDLRGRLVLGSGSGPGLTPYKHGQRGGSEAVALAVNQTPAHNHTAKSNGLPPTYSNPLNALLSNQAQVFNSQPNNVSLSDSTLDTTGGNVPHNNMMPFLALTYCICVDGQFPY